MHFCLRLGRERGGGKGTHMGFLEKPKGILGGAKLHNNDISGIHWQSVQFLFHCFCVWSNFSLVNTRLLFHFITRRTFLQKLINWTVCQFVTLSHEKAWFSNFMSVWKQSLIHNTWQYYFRCHPALLHTSLVPRPHKDFSTSHVVCMWG